MAHPGFLAPYWKYLRLLHQLLEVSAVFRGGSSSRSRRAITETALGPDHPSTALRLGNLAATYRDLGRHADALRLEERAGQIRQRPR
jgi:hypothetical protein